MASIVGGGGTSSLVTIGIIIFIISIAYFVFIRNPNFLKNLLEGGKVGAVGGNTATGPNVYQTVSSPIKYSDPSEQLQT